jgi:hypothetical protein
MRQILPGRTVFFTGAGGLGGEDSPGAPSWGKLEPGIEIASVTSMIRKLSNGQYRLYSRKLDPKTKRRRNLGTFKTRAAAEKHERAVQYFKRH